MRRYVPIVTACLAAIAILQSAAGPESIRFVVLGDRTGEAQPGVYEEAWKEAAAENPDCVVTTGDTIEGGDDATAADEWREIAKTFRTYRRFPLYLVPGNHDIWSKAGEDLFRKYSGRASHYGFDRGPAHFTVLDNSRTDDLPEGELDFLEQDLTAHAGQPAKFVLSHRPSWLVRAALGDPQFRLHEIARRHGVRYVLAGHVHQLIRAQVEGISYVSAPSSGGHLRLSKRYEDGWFFGYLVVEVQPRGIRIRVQELQSPHGQARTTALEDWGVAGLKQRPPQ